MASPEQILKASIAQESIYKLSGVKPEMDIQADYVRLFYPQTKKAAARSGWENFFKTEQTDVRIDMTGEIIPGLLAKYGLYLVGGLAALVALLRK